MLRALGSRRADNWRRLPPAGSEPSSEERRDSPMPSGSKSRFSLMPRSELPAKKRDKGKLFTAAADNLCNRLKMHALS